MRSICAPCESHRQKLQITFVVHSEWSVRHVLLNVTEKDAESCKCELRRSGGISYFKAKLTRILPMQEKCGRNLSLPHRYSAIRVFLDSQSSILFSFFGFRQRHRRKTRRARRPFPEHSVSLPFDYDDRKCQ